MTRVCGYDKLDLEKWGKEEKLLKKETENHVLYQPTTKSFVRLGITLICVVLICGLLALLLFNVSGLSGIFGKLLEVLSSVFYGIVFAYLMNPLMKLAEGLFLNLFSKKNMPERTAKRLSRGLGITVAAIVFVAVVYVIIASVVPQVIESAKDLINNKLNEYYNTITGWIEKLVSQNATLKGWYDANKEKIDIFGYLKTWLESKDVAKFFSDAIGQVYGVAKGLLNVLIGFVIAIYMLASKERFQCQAKKITVALFKPKTADRVMEVARRTNGIFGGFIVGKIIDSLIIGVLCYIGMLIFRLPYAILISALVGITNIIPFFGPLIGIACGTFLILLTDPLQALYFLIFGVVLQQIDGNIIGPKILGDRLGISDFWILVSITVFGGLFGFVGMLLGVPVFTLIYSLVNDAVNNALRKKEHTTTTGDYYDITAVSDLDRSRETTERPTVFYSEETFDSEYEPDDDIEFSDDVEDDI